MKTNKERLDDWYAKLYEVWMAEWEDMPRDDFKELLARPRRKVYTHKKRPKHRAAQASSSRE